MVARETASGPPTGGPPASASAASAGGVEEMMAAMQQQLAALRAEQLQQVEALEQKMLLALQTQQRQNEEASAGERDAEHHAGSAAGTAADDLKDIGGADNAPTQGPPMAMGGTSGQQQGGDQPGGVQLKPGANSAQSGAEQTIGARHTAEEVRR